MNAEQKRAWMAVVSGIVCVVLFLVWIPFVGPWVAFSAFALFAVNGFSGLIGRGEKADERDESIMRRATLGGFATSYVIFVLALMGVWAVVFTLQGRHQVSVHVLPNIVMLGFIGAWLTRAVLVLVYYRRHVESDDV